MEVLTQATFYNPTKGQMQLSQVPEELVEYMREKPDHPYEIIVGCDSSATQEPTFPVVVVVLRKKEGGRFFFTKVC